MSASDAGSADAGPPNDDAGSDGVPAEIAALVLAHPGVAALDGGPFGTIASYLPGRRVIGVSVGTSGDGVALSVVARAGIRLPELADELGVLVRRVLGPVPVAVTVADIAPRETLHTQPAECP